MTCAESANANSSTRAGLERLVFVSTNMVYGLPQKLPLREDHPREPFGPYGKSKLEAEKMVESSQAALEAAEKQISYDVQDAHFKSVTAKRTVDLYKNSLIPQADARFKASEAAYRTGQVSFLELLESERFLLNARVMEAMAEGNLGVQLARQERAVGTGVKYVSRPGGANQ